MHGNFKLQIKNYKSISSLASYLISGQSEFINGEFITMDGGALLQGAGSFNAMGDSLTDEQWKAIKPKKTQQQV